MVTEILAEIESAVAVTVATPALVPAEKMAVAVPSVVVTVV